MTEAADVDKYVADAELASVVPKHQRVQVSDSYARRNRICT